MNICFVILHYKTDADTIECIESIYTLKGEYSISIIVVDNCSENGSIERIEKKYVDEERIVILKNDRNLGFAEGNNVGYSYARNVLQADYIIALNNDIIIESENLIDIFIANFKKYNYGVAGPDIESLADHKHQNPKEGTEPSEKEILHQIHRYQLLYFLSKINLYDLVRKIAGSKKEKQSKDVLRDIKENVMLHGSFVVFSPLFIDKEEFAFIPGTFLYMEEELLYRYCQVHNYKTLFTPEAKVFHKEDSSTNSIFIEEKTKREFVFANMIRSLKVYQSIVISERTEFRCEPIKSGRKD